MGCKCFFWSMHACEFLDSSPTPGWQMGMGLKIIELCVTIDSFTTFLDVMQRLVKFIRLYTDHIAQKLEAKLWQGG